MSQFVFAAGLHEKDCDRRTPNPEPRIQATGTAEMTILNAATFTELTATIVDVSRSGFQILLNTPLESGRPIGLRLKTALVLGKVDNCSLNEEGCYRVGILTTSVIEL